MAATTYNGDVGSGDGSTVMFSWTLTTADHTGVGIEWSAYSDRTFVFTAGAWGGATVAIEGSNDGTNWVLLSDAAGAADATATANKAMTIVELTRYVRPRLSTPGTGATVDASALLRRATPMRT